MQKTPKADRIYYAVINGVRSKDDLKNCGCEHCLQALKYLNAEGY